jgi:hypothetical protein
VTVLPTLDEPLLLPEPVVETGTPYIVSVTGAAPTIVEIEPVTDGLSVETTSTTKAEYWTGTEDCSRFNSKI